MERHVLIVMPHPDDESMSSGGTIALYTRAGTPVTYLCGTLGQLGRNMGKPFFATRESLPGLREKELREACRILGCDLRLMGLRDKTLEFMDPEALADRVLAVINELNPSLVITYHPEYGVHPDHNALGAAAIRAVAKLPPDRRPPVHCRAFGSRVKELGDPDLVVDVREVADIKMEAIKAHRSQTEAMFAQQAEQIAKDPSRRDAFEEFRAKESFWIYKI